MSRSSRLCLVALPVLLATAGGCTLISFSTLGSLASLGNSSVSVGRDKYSFGRLTTVENVSFDLAVRAAVAAAGDLGLKVKAPVHYEDRGTRAEMAFVDDNGTQVGVRVDRRTARFVDLRIDVGWFFGSEVTDRLYLLRLRAHLPPADAAPTTRPGEAATRPVELGSVLPAWGRSSPLRDRPARERDERGRHSGDPVCADPNRRLATSA